jgi:flagellar protein FlgJ
MSEVVMPLGVNAQAQSATAKALAGKVGQSNDGSKGRDELEQACNDFESVFVSQMMQQMRKTVPQEGLFNGGRAEKIFTEMLDGEVAKSISKQRGIGLAAMMYRQLSAMATENCGDETK